MQALSQLSYGPNPSGTRQLYYPPRRTRL